MDKGIVPFPAPTPASVINDGFWQFDNSSTAGVVDQITMKPVNNIRWISTLDFGPKIGATLSTPIYVVGEVQFAAPHSIETLVAVCPSNNNAGPVGGPNFMTRCGIRDYDMQVNVGSLSAPQWNTVKSVTGSSTEWVLCAHLNQPVSCVAVRIVIKDINNGRWYGDKTPLPTVDASAMPIAGKNVTALLATLYELEAWGAN